MKTPIQELIKQVEEWMLEDKEVLENPSVWSEYMYFQAISRVEMKSEFIEMCKEMLEKEKKDRKAVFSIAYRMMPKEYDSAHIDSEFKSFNETFNAKER
jgi:hypothetical protein